MYGESWKLIGLLKLKMSQRKAQLVNWNAEQKDFFLVAAQHLLLLKEKTKTITHQGTDRHTFTWTYSKQLDPSDFNRINYGNLFWVLPKIFIFPI